MPIKDQRKKNSPHTTKSRITIFKKIPTKKCKIGNLCSIAVNFDIE